MNDKPTVSIVAHFGGIEYPRVEYLVDHKLIDIIGLCAVIAGAQIIGQKWNNLDMRDRAGSSSF